MLSFAVFNLILRPSESLEHKTGAETPDMPQKQKEALLHQSTEPILLLPAICETSRKQLSLVELDEIVYGPPDDFVPNPNAVWSWKRSRESRKRAEASAREADLRYAMHISRQEAIMQKIIDNLKAMQKNRSEFGVKMTIEVKAQ